MNKGTSQETRKSKALSADYIALDERSMLDMMQFTLDFSENINFYDYQKNRVDSWKPFLLNDSAFVIAMIAATDLNEFKIADNNSEYQAKNTNNEDHINSLKKNIFKTIKQWQLFLTRSNYKGILINESGKLIDSVENKNPKTKSSEET